MGRLAEHGGAVTSVAVISTVALISGFIYFQRQYRRRSKHVWPGVLKESEKPQQSFRRVLADRSRTPFVHLRNDESGNDFSHPYEARIREILEYPALNFKFMQLDYEKPLGMKGPFEWIETLEDLEALAHLLSKETEFAVDTEQHSVHSFHGFTALVQISTRQKDYLVNSIALHDSMDVLRAVFANPAICKVFHGGDNDVLWLQRDFHIYVVNMFDTAKACLILGKAQRSLAYLLQMYCGVETNKAFQRADWRLRPLPKEMVEYARTDAHYLLYIAHRLYIELVPNNSVLGEEAIHADAENTSFGRLLEQALYRSNLTCIQLYEKEGVSASPSSTSTTLLTRFFNGLVTPPRQVDEQFSNLVTGLCQWRDHVARVEDESLRSVLSDAALMALAMSRPSTPELIYATISAADGTLQVSELEAVGTVPTFVSPSLFVERHIEDLHNFIQSSETGQPGVVFMQTKLGPLEYISSLFGKAFASVKLPGNVEKNERYQNMGISSVGTWEYKLPKRWRGSSEKSRMQFVKKFSCKAPVYHNCRIYADDGRLLCFCDRKKLEWYVRRGLAEVVQEEPPAVRLLFEPKGRPEDEGNDFYIQSKSNQCVGCGENSHYLRYRVIPSCYRQHFPEHLKSHRSHDIVLLCVDCHEIAHKAAEKHKRQISREYGVPLFVKVKDSEGLIVDEVKPNVLNGDEEGVSPLQLKNAAMALLRHGAMIPNPRRLELEAIVRTYYGRDSIVQQDLHAILMLSMRPHELRRFLKRSSISEVSSSTGLEIAITETWKMSGNELPVNRTESNTSVQDDDKNCSAVDSTKFKGDTSVVDVMPPGPIGIKHIAASQQKGTDVLADQPLEPLPTLSKAHKHESLLGHGTHGRKVVEILLKQEGEDGIRSFSQQWRRVFVDALHPAFLPMGWNVNHSGRRDFGDFSVYKLPEGH